MQRRLGNFLLGLILPIVLFAAWIYFSSNGSFAESELPKPSSVFAVITELDKRDQLWWNISASLQRVALGYFFGTIIALILGSAAGLNKDVNRLVTPL